MKTIQLSRKQAGFTIIELVVVILLLGILTATALPRFLDLTTEAHEAVVDGVESGLRTGVALYRAQWIGQGQPAGGTVLNEYDVPVNPFGFPGSANGEEGGEITDANDGTFDESAGSEAGAHGACVAIYNGLLQTGAPSIVASADTAIANFKEDDDSTTTTDIDFMAKYTAGDSAGTGTCTFAYLADTAATADRTVPGITYTASSGEVNRIVVTIADPTT